MNDRFHFQDGEKMKKKVQPKMVYVILFLLTVFLVYGWRLGTGRVIHSDELSVIFAGQDMFSGDPFLKGWHLTTGVFLLPTIELACAVYTFGYSETLVYIDGFLRCMDCFPLCQKMDRKKGVCVFDRCISDIADTKISNFAECRYACAELCGCDLGNFFYLLFIWNCNRSLGKSWMDICFGIIVCDKFYVFVYCMYSDFACWYRSFV